MESVGARGWQRGPAVVPEASAGPWGHGETCACFGGGKAEMPVQTAAAGAKRGNQGGAWNSCKLRELLPPTSHPGCRLPFQVAHKHLLSQKPRLKNRQAINYLIFLFFSWPVLPVVVGVCMWRKNYRKQSWELPRKGEGRSVDECPAWGEGRSSVQDIKLCDFPKRADDGNFYIFGGRVDIF